MHGCMQYTLTSLIHIIVQEVQEVQSQMINGAGLCIICSCPCPKNGELIIGCTAPNKIKKCFKDDLGFLVKEFSSDLSVESMRKILHDLPQFIPESFEENFRLFFYFFGHGNETEICLTDGNFPRDKLF